MKYCGNGTLNVRMYFQPKKKVRRIVAVDETKIKKEGKQLYLWNAIDIDDYVILATHLSTSRTSFDAIYFLRMGLEYQHETFGWRTPIEQWYSQFKVRGNTFGSVSLIGVLLRV